MKRRFSWLFPTLLLVTAEATAHPGDVDLGVGLSYIDMGNGSGIDGGFDFQLGYEMVRSHSMNVGAQLHLTRSLDAQSDVSAEGDLNYSSTGLYLTARPHNWWLQFKGGVVQADYASYDGDETRLGYGVGAGIVINSMGVNLHLLDYQRFVFGKDSFDVYTLSFTIMN